MRDFIRLTNTIGKTTCSLYKMRLTYSSFLDASITAKKRVIACHFQIRTRTLAQLTSLVYAVTYTALLKYVRGAESTDGLVLFVLRGTS